jgi:hypothetical protein
LIRPRDNHFRGPILGHLNDHLEPHVSMSIRPMDNHFRGSTLGRPNDHLEPLVSMYIQWH